MRRRLFNLATAVSLVVGIVVALICVAGWLITADEVGEVRSPSGYWHVESYQGWISLYRYDSRFGDYRESIAIHYWHVIALGFTPLILALLRRGLQLRRRKARGVCPTCGYDLRATPERCPECGTPIPADRAALTPVTSDK